MGNRRPLNERFLYWFLSTPGLLLLVLATSGLCWLSASPPPSSNAATIVVHASDIDSNGHVNNARYVDFLQRGRWTWLESGGIARDRLAAENCALFVVRIELNYRKEVRLHERLVVTSHSERVGAKSFVVRQEILRDGDVVADALVTLVPVDLTTRKSRPIPNFLLKSLNTGD
jgi:YbgC/YbaW family acyl-CoA thioester hydrolase